VKRALLAVLLAACGGGGDDGDDDVGEGEVDGAAPRPDATFGPDAGPCSAVDGDPQWLDGMLADAIGKLSGNSDITPGVRLSDRASAQRRGVVRDWLLGELAAQGIDGALHDYGMGANVVARLPGSDAGAGWVLVGAHFDTVNGSPGANDNASGTAAVLATARLLRDTCRSRGVIVAFFDQEEIGLIGSTYLAMDLFQQGDDVIAVHTVDQVAWDEDGDRVYEIELPTDALYQQYVAAAGALGLATSRTDTSGTDHSAFRDRGFDAAGVTEEYVGGDTTPHYHESTDTYATVDVAYAADAVRLVSRVIATATE
jgi:hypothetical protein